MKFTAKHVCAITALLWLLLFLPFFVPELNTIEPHVLGLPFIVFYDFAIIFVHIALTFVAKKYTWDSFDKDAAKEK
jgi:hypothetical protein